ncbi:MAG: radical SAM peptide maturase, CXXX-repeat target family [Clostridiales bacterium]|nr:radical SAM peptide maturase, CXXX-repeat target family [Clostridiales bacterium]
MRTKQEFSERFAKYLDGDGELFQRSPKYAARTIDIVVTESCNLNCSYCYESSKGSGKVMTRETGRRVVDQILSNSSIRKYLDPDGGARALVLDFIGGEPLLQIDLIDYICDYFKYQVYKQNHQFQNYMFSMSTNGTLYHDAAVQKFIRKNKGRLSVTISIDGDKELHDACRVFHDGTGSHGVVEANVRRAVKEIGLNSTKVTIAPENLRYLSANIPYLVSLGLTAVNANVVFENVWKPKDAELFYSELIKLADWLIEDRHYESCDISLFSERIGLPLTPEDNNNWCGGTGLMLAVGTDGGLYPCIRYMRYCLANQPELRIGNVCDGITEQRTIQELNAITRRSQSADECFNCPVASGCAWCSGYNYDCFGTPNKRATFICGMHKARVKANEYYWTKLREAEK